MDLLSWPTALGHPSVAVTTIIATDRKENCIIVGPVSCWHTDISLPAVAFD